MKWLRLGLPSLLAGWLLVSQPLAARTLVVYGDSISAAYGMAEAEGWVQLLANRLAETHPAVQVVNASLSGETTGGGMTRLAKTLEAHRPALLVLELGGNDGLRGYPIRKIRENLEAMVVRAHAAGAQVLLVGMALPPNYGRRYTSAFREIFAALAQEHSLAFVPGLLDTIGTDKRLMQADGIHPRAEAQPQILESVWRQLAPLLDRLDGLDD